MTKMSLFFSSIDSKRESDKILRHRFSRQRCPFDFYFHRRPLCRTFVEHLYPAAVALENSTAVQLCISPLERVFIHSHVAKWILKRSATYVFFSRPHMFFSSHIYVLQRKFTFKATERLNLQWAGEVPVVLVCSLEGVGGCGGLGSLDCWKLMQEESCNSYHSHYQVLASRYF